VRLYNYLDRRAINVVKEWTADFGKRDLAALNEKLDALQKVTDPLRELPGLIFGPGIGGHQEIWKLKIGGSGSGNALRPLLCKGPVDKGGELTLLAGATERDGNLKPEGIEDIAEKHRKDIVNDNTRRCDHEPIRPKIS
jgi:hypothetical protein